MNNNFDLLFGPKDSSSSTSSSSSSTGLFGSIFPPPSFVGGRESRTQLGMESKKGENSNKKKKNTSSTKYDENENERVMESSSYFTSSIHYGAQENYSPRTTTQPHHLIFKKDKDEGDSNGNDPSSASRGNWWQGSLYY